MPKQRHIQSSHRTARRKLPTRAHPKRAATQKATSPSRGPAKKAQRVPARLSRKKVAARPATRTSAPRRATLTATRTKPPAGPSPHELAINVFERGFKALQQRQFGRAGQLLSSVVTNFPDEKELQERARVYLSICERQTGGPGTKPRSFEERMNAATVAINRGAFDEGLGLLHQLESQDSASDHVQYMLCVAYTSAGDTEKALRHLRRAIELNPENRFLSTADMDLEPLRQLAGFAAAITPPPPARRQGAKKR